MCICVYASVPWCTRGSQRTACESWFSPFTVWILETELGSPNLGTFYLTWSLSCQAWSQKWRLALAVPMRGPVLCFPWRFPSQGSVLREHRRILREARDAWPSRQANILHASLFSPGDSVQGWRSALWLHRAGYGWASVLCVQTGGSLSQGKEFTGDLYPVMWLENLKDRKI